MHEDISTYIYIQAKRFHTSRNRQDTNISRRPRDMIECVEIQYGYLTLKSSHSMMTLNILKEKVIREWKNHHCKMTEIFR